MFPLEERVYLEMFNALLPRIQESVTPIGLCTTDGIRQHGTGTLVAVGEVHFLVSAAHVLDSARDAKLPLFCYAYGEKTDQGRTIVPVPLEGTRFSWPDPLDVGVVKLTDATVSRLTGRKFLRLCDVALRPAAPGWGWVSGFPLGMVQPVGDTSEAYNPLNWGSVISTAEPTNVSNFDTRFHFVLEHDPQEAAQLTGDPFKLPASFGGISGCAVWQTWWPIEEQGAEWRSRKIRIVGVQTGCYRKRTIKATNWAAVAVLLAAAAPELQPVLQLHFPGWDARDQIYRLAKSG
ncbi:unnamed protein product [Gemmata massiliana]|uniref:Peptidase S1 domain-containing protein n=1 Tax=Gemmata massiliana TaxID=1210884 RepID=A0A6P2CT60_9BACT|nr:hypothetical protein [Gemmata massiliana]VTR91566.1 unnamed protein product [Gemmata massiliana]